MVCLTEGNRAAFESRLKMIEEGLAKRSEFLIDENLKCVKKTGFRWFILCLMRPFYALCGKDVYSHVKVHNVASKIFNYCEANKQFFSEDVHLIKKIKDKILVPLDNRTGKKYQQVLERTINQLYSLAPPELRLKIPHFFPKALSKWQWPADLSKLDITVQQKDGLEKALAAIAHEMTQDSDCTIEIQKSQTVSRSLIIKHSSQLIQTIPLPLNLFFLTNDQKDTLIGILLLTKKVIGKGGERTVKLCFNLTNGSYLVKKRVVRDTEKLVIQYLKEHPIRGIATLCQFREVSMDPKPFKRQIIEPFYEGTLTTLFGTPVLVDLKQKLFFMQDLLSGLAGLHAMHIQGCSYNTKPLGQIQISHLDIKPDNILVRPAPNENRWEAVISDFGCAGDVAFLGGTNGYKAPEEVNLEIQLDPLIIKNKLVDLEPIIRHNMRYGQAMDMWALGLVFIEILTGKISTRVVGSPIPPLPCIEDCFFKVAQGAPHRDQYIGKLTQQEIDRDLHTLKNSNQRSNATEQLVVHEIWDLISAMLKVRAEDRISAKVSLLTITKAILQLIPVSFVSTRVSVASNIRS